MTTSKPPSTTPDGTAQPVPSGAYESSTIRPCSGCGSITTWQHYSGCPYLPSSQARPAPLPSAQVSGLGTGWQCPVCRQVYAPWVYSCPGFGHTTATTGANVTPSANAPSRSAGPSDGKDSRETGEQRG